MWTVLFVVYARAGQDSVLGNCSRSPGSEITCLAVSHGSAEKSVEVASGVVGFEADQPMDC